MLKRKHAVVAERLRRLTRNQFPSGSAGSNPADCGHFFLSEENIKYPQNQAVFLRPSVRMQRCVTAKKRIPARVQLESEHEP